MCLQLGYSSVERSSLKQRKTEMEAHFFFNNSSWNLSLSSFYFSNIKSGCLFLYVLNATSLHSSGFHTWILPLRTFTCYLYNNIVRRLHLCSAGWTSLFAALQMNGKHKSDFLHVYLAQKAKSWFSTIGWFGALAISGTMLTSLNGPQSLLALTRRPLVTKYNGVHTGLKHCPELHR